MTEAPCMSLVRENEATFDTPHVHAVSLVVMVPPARGQDAAITWHVTRKVTRHPAAVLGVIVR
ncbi:hypothetical protein PTE30175_01630 [Pandoraea terrae]|uniref:Uncharacterized protein n=1 Tax=Pandoraea terrae TaxID=1537710 RepID=A0A5E4TY42_9BURK|nr:hypothetical protein [Pandoraea terrae]VVD92461.1 hypothetical protein PTE30175_01630 [Pandoraea terrae]